jgi:hypothetical protein
MSDLGQITRCYSLRYERASRHPPARGWHLWLDDLEHHLSGARGAPHHEAVTLSRAYRELLAEILGLD